MELNGEKIMKIVKSKHFWLGVYGYGTLIFAFVCTSFWSYWTLYPYKTIEHFPDNHIIEESYVKQGQTAFYSFDYCNYTDITPTVSKWFIDGIVYEAPADSQNLPKGCGHARIPFTIPKTLPPGTYKMKIQTAYRVNPIREIVETNITETFTVLQSEEGAYGEDEIN